jgi:hypothetical protein
MQVAAEAELLLRKTAASAQLADSAAERDVLTRDPTAKGKVRLVDESADLGLDVASPTILRRIDAMPNPMPWAGRL